ncbi:MAG: hypothetical protein QXW10_04190, partial [Candidatus Micrarchaeaceae archaeon]
MAKRGDPYGAIGFNLKYMDKSIDPFDNFYRYACGNWIKSHRLPSDKSELGSFDMLQEKNMAKLMRIAERCARRQGSSHAARIVGGLYASY